MSAASEHCCCSTGAAGTGTRPRSDPSRSTRGFTPEQLGSASGTIETGDQETIMDQRYLAGVGNIYANEALFAARIDPSKPSNRLTPDDHARLYTEIRRILHAAIDSKGSTVRDYRTGTGLPGNFQLELQVYEREGQPCVRCGTRLAGTHEIDGRITVFCFRCQRVSTRRAQRAAHLPAGDLDELRNRVRALAENRPAVYRMLDSTGGFSTSARPSGSAPGCSAISGRHIPTTRRRAFCTRRRTSPGTMRRASSRRTWASCDRSAATAPISIIAAT